MKTALLVIDAQQSFVRRPYFQERALVPYLVAQNALIEGCSGAGVPIVRILHTDGPETPDNPFAPGSGLVRPLDGVLAPEPAATFIKHRHSALVGTGLDVWLVQQGVQRLIVSGIRTEQCCETTTRHASDLGWQVDFVAAATLTFDIPLGSRPLAGAADSAARDATDGQALSAAAIVERSCAVLDGRFAKVCDVATALQRARAAA